MVVTLALYDVLAPLLPSVIVIVANPALPAVAVNVEAPVVLTLTTVGAEDETEMEPPAPLTVTCSF